jgi:hypothetical protein
VREAECSVMGVEESKEKVREAERKKKCVGG